MNSSRGLGYKVDKPDERDRLFASARSLPPEILRVPDVRPYLVAPVRDQRATGSCVGQALGAAIEVTSLARHGRAARISSRYLYAIGRELENPASRAPLSDSGSYPRLVMQAARSRGILAEKAFPFSEEAIDERPGPTASVAAFESRALDYYRIDARGQERLDAVKSALLRGFGVLFGMKVDAAYQRNEGDVVRSMGAPIGGHMQLVAALDGTTVAVLNSWGTGWGDRGFAHYDLGFFAECEISDLYAVTWVPGVDDAA